MRTKEEILAAIMTPATLDEVTLKATVRDVIELTLNLDSNTVSIAIDSLKKIINREVSLRITLTLEVEPEHILAVADDAGAIPPYLMERIEKELLG